MFSIDFNKNEKKYVQVGEYFKRLISSNSIAPGSKLPSTRELSESLGVGRSTILRAYEYLEMKGLVYTVEGRGTYVSQKEDKKNYGTSNVERIEWKKRVNAFSERAVQLDIMKWDSKYKKGMISFKSIAPDGKTFDIEGFKRAFYSRISIEESNILNYGYARGYEPLREWLKEYIRGKGIDTEGKDILITNGFTEGLNLVLETILEDGHKILCENPTHNTAIKIMKLKGIEVIGLDIKDNNGIDIEELKTHLSEGDIKAAFLIPSYHNPTGIVMDINKRMQVYSILKEHGVVIIEDWFAEELQHSGDHIKSISAISGKDNSVINIGSFSKIMFPGLRIGWIFGDKELIDTLESVKRALNIHTSFLDQGVMFEYLKGDDVHRFIKRVKRQCREKFIYTKEMVKKYIPHKMILGEGGLYVYVVLDKGIDIRLLSQRCMERDVIFTCGDIFDVNFERGIESHKGILSEISNGMRLGFSRLNKREIASGIRIIGEELSKLISEGM